MPDFEAESGGTLDTRLARYGVTGPRYTSYPTADRFIEADKWRLSWGSVCSEQNLRDLPVIAPEDNRGRLSSITYYRFHDEQS